MKRHHSLIYYCCMRVTQPILQFLSSRSMQDVWVSQKKYNLLFLIFFPILKHGLISTPCKFGIFYVVLTMCYLKKRGFEVWISYKTTKVIRLSLSSKCDTISLSLLTQRDNISKNVPPSSSRQYLSS